MPHIDKKGTEHQRVYVRVTEALAVSECEERGWHTKELIKEIERGERTTAPNVMTYATIKGTLLHHDIENWMRERIDLPPLVFQPKATEEAILFNIENSPELSKQLDEDLATGFTNFLDFWNEFEPDILFIEQQFLGEVKGVPMKGTVDAILLFRRGDLDTVRGVTTGDPEEKVIMITDWKSGSKHMSSHRTQISAYYHMASQGVLVDLLDKYDYYRIDGVPIGADAYFGGKTFKFKLFDVSESLFFHVVELFKKAQKVPRNILIGRDMGGRIGLNLQYCLYCPFKEPCQTLVQLEVEL